MKLEEYLQEFPELGILHGSVKQAFLAKGLVHHNWNHVLRDLARGTAIGEKEGANMKIVLASIFLHDIGRLHPELGVDHYSVGTEVAPKYLERAGFLKMEIKDIVHCIRSHGPRAPEEPRTPEAKVCYDAEVFSCSLGYLGVARVFDYFMREEGAGIRGMIEIPSGRSGPRRDFYTETGRRLGEKGLQKSREFWKELEEEFMEEERIIREAIPDYEAD